MAALQPVRSRRDGRRSARRAGRGVTLVELMIGVAIGLVIAAGGVSFLTGNLREHRSLLLESRLMQDLRTAADIVTRDLRRAGYWSAAERGIWMQGAGAVLANPYTVVAPEAAASDNVSFRFSRDATENHAVDSNEQFGFRLRGGALEMQLGAANWQALTDGGTVTVTAFSVTPSVQQVSLADSCASACPVGNTTCPPQVNVRSFALQITGRSATDANVVRTVRSTVRLRNDSIVGACAA